MAPQSSRFLSQMPGSHHSCRHSHSTHTNCNWFTSREIIRIESTRSRCNIQVDNGYPVNSLFMIWNHFIRIPIRREVLRRRIFLIQWRCTSHEPWSSAGVQEPWSSAGVQMLLIHVVWTYSPVQGSMGTYTGRCPKRTNASLLAVRYW